MLFLLIPTKMPMLLPLKSLLHLFQLGWLLLRNPQLQQKNSSDSLFFNDCPVCGRVRACLCVLVHMCVYTTKLQPLRAGMWPFFSMCVPQLCLTFCNPVDHSPLSMGFSSEEYWNGLPCPPPGDPPSPGMEPPSQVSCFGRLVLFLPAPALFSSSFQSRSRNFPSAAIGVTSDPTLPQAPATPAAARAPRVLQGWMVREESIQRC